MQPVNIYETIYALVLLVMGFRAPVIASSLKECSKEFGKVQRCAVLKASGCMNRTNTDALEILTNTPPIDLHLKQRQAQEIVRISAKHEEDPLKADFNSWLDNTHTAGRKPTLFHLLMSRFREMSGKIDIESIEKVFQYTKELMCLMKVKEKTDYRDEFRNSEEVQEVNIRDKLRQIKDVVFTGGSALRNPGPTGGGAVIYFTNPILLKKRCQPH